jgi:MFS transporter, ACS family, hexuronate transporter
MAYASKMMQRSKASMTSERQSASRSFQKKIVFLIFIITFINYLDRGSISFAIVPIEKALQINNREFGLVSASFGIGYFAMCFFGGLLVDRFGPVRAWSYSAIAWSLAILATGLSQGFWSLFFLRLILGVAEAIHFPALVKTAADYLDRSWRAKCISLGLLGVPLASLIGAPSLSALIEAAGWKWMFVFLSLPGFIWAVLWRLFLRKKKSPLDQNGSAQSKAEILLQSNVCFRKTHTLKHFFSSRYFIGNCLNFYIFGYIVFFALMWVPGYLEQTYQISILKTGAFLILPWTSSAALIMLGGWVSDAIWKQTKSIRKARVLPIGLGMLFAGICFLLMALSSHFFLSVLLLSLGLGFAFFANSPIFSLNIDLFKEKAGTAQGIMASFFAFSGITSPAITGWLAQSSGNFKSSIFLVCILSFIAVLLSLFLQKEKEKPI